MKFKRTLRQLTIWYSCIVFVLLLMLGGLLYGITNLQIYADIDKSLARYYSSLEQREVSPGNSVLVIEDQELKRFINPSFIFWDSTGEIIIPDYKVEYAGIGPIFKKQLKASRPTTVQHGQITYRLINRPYQEKLSLLVKNVKNVNNPITKVQLFVDITAEQYFLNKLLWITCTGIGFGAILSIVTGYGLARRALVPIQHGWDKQQRFITDASHELRTPLAVVQSHAQLLLRHPANTIQEESLHISTVLKETKRMTNMVNSLLLLTRGDSHEEKSESKPVLFNQLLQEVGLQIGLIMEYKQLRFHQHIEGSDLYVKGDEDRLKQLIIILLDNAMKFTPNNGKNDLESNYNGKMLNVMIKDNGVGIPKEDLPFVFDRFFIGNFSRTKGENGAGLGLSIASWIVEQHHGSIDITSESGHGTTVTVSLPVMQGSAS